jgi:hypothetical protein
MKPERAQELYSDYAEGALTPALTQALEQHFESDPTARADYDQFAQIYALLELPLGQEVEAPLGFRAKILEQVAAEQSRRETVGSSSLVGWFGGWFGPASNRRAFGGTLAAFTAVAVIGAIMLHPGSKNNTDSATMLPGITIASPTASVLIQKVDMGTGADSTDHLFHLHLPATVTAATVNAYVITDTDQITDPAHLADATPALTQQHLSNHQGVQIPIAPAQAPPPGSTLNLLAQWTPDNSAEPSGAEVAFTPFGPADPATAAPANAQFLDAMQAVAAHYGVTVIVDTQETPTLPVSADFSGSDPQAPLATLAKQVNYTVQKLPDGTNTYFVVPAAGQ